MGFAFLSARARCTNAAIAQTWILLELVSFREKDLQKQYLINRSQPGF